MARTSDTRAPKTLPLPHPLASHGLPRYGLLVGVTSLALALVALPFDVMLSDFLRGNWIGGDLRRLILLSEVYAHGTGVIMILLTIWVLDSDSRRRLWRVAACAFGGGLAANLVKLCIGRIRPHSLPDGAGSLDTFTGLLPMAFSSTQSYGSAMQSFPSAHTATAVGLALGMAWLYPRGRVLFAVFAGMSAMQRLVTGAHYPSDVLFGTMLGVAVAHTLLHSRLGGRWFAHFENRRAAHEVATEDVKSAA